MISPMAVFKHAARSRELWAGAVLALVVFTLRANPHLISSAEPQYEHLGGEYFNIAQAMVAGRGFADPFGDPSGPTAWMPPLFPSLLAGLLAILKERSAVASVVLVLSDLTWIGIGVCVVRLAARFQPRVPALVSIALYVGWLLLFYDWLFLLTHDIWLLALFATLILFALASQSASGRVKPWSWGVLGGLTALASPTLSVAWGGVTAVYSARLPGQRRRALHALLVAAALAAPWLIRNACTLGTLAGMKSNLFFEAYQANYVDDDGIVDARSLASHPYNSPASRFEYVRLGEQAFLSRARSDFVDAVEREPARYFKGVANRALAVSVEDVPFVPAEFAPPRRIEQLVYPLPFVGLLLTLLLRKRGDDGVRPMAWFYFFYFAVYVLVSFYVRYLLILTPALVLFMFLGLDTILRARHPNGVST